MKHTCLSLNDHIFVCLNVSRTPSAQHSLHSMLWGGVGIQVEHLSRGSWQIECCTHGELCILWEVKHFGGVWAFACSRIGCVEPLPLSGGTGALPLHDCVEPCLFLEGSCFVDRLRRAVAHVFGDRFLALVCLIPCDPSWLFVGFWSFGWDFRVLALQTISLCLIHVKSLIKGEKCSKPCQ